MIKVTLNERGVDILDRFRIFCSSGNLSTNVGIIP